MDKSGGRRMNWHIDDWCSSLRRSWRGDGSCRGDLGELGNQVDEGGGEGESRTVDSGEGGSVVNDCFRDLRMPWRVRYRLKQVARLRWGSWRDICPHVRPLATPWQMIASSSSENRLRGLPCTTGGRLLFIDLGDNGGDAKLPGVAVAVIVVVVAGLRMSETESHCS